MNFQNVGGFPKKCVYMNSLICKLQEACAISGSRWPGRQIVTPNSL